jgi:hypothetical protein
MATTPAAGKKTGYIYALSHNGVIKYVGQAKDLQRRYSQHTSLAQNMGKLKRNYWIQSLLLNGEQPIITSLEKSDDVDAAEIKWIADLRGQGIDLLNISDGGQSMGSLHRAKALKPWGKRQSPVQHALIIFKRTTATMKRYGTPEMVVKSEQRYNDIVELINRVGKDKMNMLMWEKDGDSYYAR